MKEFVGKNRKLLRRILLVAGIILLLIVGFQFLMNGTEDINFFQLVLSIILICASFYFTSDKFYPKN